MSEFLAGFRSCTLVCSGSVSWGLSVLLSFADFGPYLKKGDPVRFL